MSDSRGQWASKFGFIMAAAGSSVGLGNIWRFPSLTGESGGGAFVVVYVACVALIGVPVLINEMALGRLTGKSTIAAFRATGGNLIWRLLGGVLAVTVSFAVVSYYSAIAGWTLGYMGTSLVNHPIPFKEFIATVPYVVPLFALAILVSIVIVLGGISGGIEKATRIMMPLLFVLLLVTIIRSLTLPGAAKGIAYYLIPDFSKINGVVILKALTQAFFSLGVGWGIMVTYGSYLKKDQNIPGASLWVAGMDTGIALLGGLMVFPAVFAFDMEPNSGYTLVFEVLANVFPLIPFGNIAGAIFFLLLFIAAITSTISMVEVVGSWLIDSRHWNRKTATWVVGGAAFLLGLPSALSYGGSKVFSEVTLFGKTGVLEIMDYALGSISMLIVVLVTCLYTGWAMNTAKLVDEIEMGAPAFKKNTFLGISMAQLWVWCIRFLCPFICGAVLLSVLGVF